MSVSVSVSPPPSSLSSVSMEGAVIATSLPLVGTPTLGCTLDPVLS
jgi:hypothetical protein